MTKKTGLFIFEKREVWVLFLLAITVAVFAFILGVHLGKKVGDSQNVAELKDATPAHTADDMVPDRVQLTEQAQGVDQAVTESLNQALHEEVQNAGIKLNVKRQVQLPEKTVSKNAGATTLESDEKKEVIPALVRQSPEGKYTIQVGSFPSLSEASEELSALENKGVEPFMRHTLIRGKGEWYRIYLGGYDSKKQAETIAHKYVKEQVIRSFIVANMPSSMKKQ